MNTEIEALLEKAKRSQKAAAKLLRDGDIVLLLPVPITPFSMSPRRFCSRADFRFQVILE